MTNLELVISILAKHREARMWADESVAADVLAQLGVDPAAAMKVTEAEVLAAEAAAQEATDRAVAYRAALVAALTPAAEPLSEGEPTHQDDGQDEHHE